MQSHKAQLQVVPVDRDLWQLGSSQPPLRGVLSRKKEVLLPPAPCVTLGGSSPEAARCDRLMGCLLQAPWHVGAGWYPGKGKDALPRLGEPGHHLRAYS